MLGKVLTGVTALLALVGVPVAAETYAGRQLGGSVRIAVQRLAPGATVTRVEPHGRPYLASLLHGEVSSAYAEVRSPSGTTMLILQRLNADSGHVSAVLWFARARQPAGLAPVRTPGGAYTPRGTVQLDGRQLEVTYDAARSRGTVSVRPRTVTVDGRLVDAAALPARWSAALTPAPLRTPAKRPLGVRAVSVGEGDITVGLRQTDVDTGPAAGRR